MRFRPAYLSLALLGLAALADPTLPNDGRLPVEGELVSSNGEFRFTLQPGGRLAVQRKTASPAAGAAWQEVWSAGGSGPFQGRQELRMQRDNNLVLYDIVGGTEQRSAWSTETAGQSPEGTGRLVLQDDGELTVLSGSDVLWSSRRKIMAAGGGSSKVEVSLPKK
jgi:hypothetical protein